MNIIRDKYLLKIIYLVIYCSLDILQAADFKIDQIDFKAQKIDYQLKDNLIIISGDAILSGQDSVIKADIIYYDTKEQLIYATGNIYFKDKDNNEFYPDSILVDQKFQNITMNDINGKFKDKSLINAQSFERNTPNKYELYDVCYTSCHSKGLFSPIWQVKSNEGFYNTDKDQVVFYNAWIEIANIPILWTPYASFSNFKKIREMGFLYPRYSINSTLGSVVEIPFYIPIGESQQIIIKNYTYSNLQKAFHSNKDFTYNGYLPRVKYNGYIDNGDFDLDTSFYKEDWHVYLKFNHEFNDIFRSKLSIEKTSSISYINLYEINPKDTKDPYFNSYIINELFFDTNHYMVFNAYSYEDISPQANPYNYNNELLMSYNYFSDANNFGAVHVSGDLDNFADVDNNLHTKINLSLNYDYKYLTHLGNYAINMYYVNSLAFETPNVNSNSTMNPNNNPNNKQDPLFSYNSIGLTYEYPTNYFVKNILITASPIINFSINTIINQNENTIALDYQKDFITANNLFESSQYHNFDYINPNNALGYGVKLNGKINDSNASVFAGQKLETTDKFDARNITNTQRTPSNYFFALSLVPTKHIYVNYEAVYLPEFKQQRSSSTLAFNSAPVVIRLKYNTNIDNLINEFSINSQINFASNFMFSIDTLYNVSYVTPMELKTLNSSLTWFNECLYLQGYISQSYYANYVENSYGVRILIKGVGDNDLKIL